MNEPTHIQTNSSSCTDLIFTDQPSMSANSGVHASLHPNCHHQVVHASFNLHITFINSSDSKKTDISNIRKVLDLINWEKRFSQKNINAQVTVFNETILNISRNYIPNKYITCDDKDLVWMNENMKSKIKSKNLLYKQYTQNGRKESDLIVLENLIAELNELITSTKALYYENLGKKLNNPLLQIKMHWSILKTFYNDKKIPLILPLLIDNKFVTDIRTKANIFKKFFAEQCTPLNNGSVLPSNQEFLIQERLCLIDLSDDEILKLIRSLKEWFGKKTKCY